MYVLPLSVSARVPRLSGLLEGYGLGEKWSADLDVPSRNGRNESGIIKIHTYSINESEFFHRDVRVEGHVLKVT